MEIKNHRLVNAEFKQTPNIGKPFEGTLPDTIVIHFTAGGSVESSVHTLCDRNSSASAHLVIGRDGKIVQLADFNIVTWHAGKSSMKEPSGNVRSGINQYSIGIEIDNAGLLKKKEDGSFVTWFGKNIPNNEVVSGIHRNETVSRFWHTYTQEQIDVVNDICKSLIAFYNIKYIVGHEEIAPVRKSDPGPAFPLDKMRERLLVKDRGSDEPSAANFPIKGTVDASTLNIRISPDIAAELKAKPLVKGAPVKILGEKNGWYEVETPVRGWVNAKYITKS